MCVSCCVYCAPLVECAPRFRVEAKGGARGPGLRPGSHVQVELDMKFWAAPEVSRRNIKRETVRIVWVSVNRQVAENDRVELESFKQS